MEIKIPDIGDFDEVTVIEILVKAGDYVRAEQSLITVESDKASMEIPSSHAGVVESLVVKLGDKVKEGSVILNLNPSPAAAATSSTASDKAEPKAAPAETSKAAAEEKDTTSAPVSTQSEKPAAPAVTTTSTSDATGKLPNASPSVRQFARELGVALERVSGSGPNGRITHEDVKQFCRTALSNSNTTSDAATGGTSFAGLLPWPNVDFEKFGAVEREPLSRIKKISGANLHRNWVMIPHVCNHDDADITELEAFRVQLNREHEKSGVKVTMLAFLIKACVAALKEFPNFNASLDGETLVLKRYFHIGFAADTPQGLVVPVIQNADQKGVLELANEMKELSAKARAGKLSPAEMTGGSFTISSLGGIGGRYFTPIINAPEVAILGVCKAQQEPVWDGKAFVPRLMLPLSLSWDHRVIDGAGAARFNAYLSNLLADMRRVLL